MRAGAGAPVGDGEGVVCLVRHGEVHNPHAVRYGRLPGYGLSSAGFAQARRAAAWLREHAALPVRAVRSSPLLRARETAAVLRDALAPGEEIALVDALTELRTPFDGLPREAAAHAYARRLVAAIPGRFSAWERHASAALRVANAAREAALESSRSGGAVVLVSHQAPIWLACLALEHGYGSARAGVSVRLAPWRFRGPTPAYASVTELRFATAQGEPVRVRYVDCAS